MFSFDLDSNIKLQYDHGYSWFGDRDIKVKGWAIDNRGFSYEDKKLEEHFSGVNDVETLRKSIENLTGHFSVVIKLDEDWLAAVDRCRSFPLYYSVNDNHVCLSDSAFSIADSLNLKIDFENIAINEYLTTGYVLGNKTFFKEINQICAGDIVFCNNGNIQIFPYFRYLSDKQISLDLEETSTLFLSHLDKIFENLIKGLNGRKVVIPLSGGYDSRLIASMFRRHGYDNVLCYSFGKKGNPEMVTSEKVAEILNFPWLFFETTKEGVKGFAESKRFLKYIEFAANADSFYIIQDYFALKKMYEEKLIPRDSVFMPGHSGDTIGGSNFLGAIRGDETRDGIAEQIIKHKFNLRKISKYQQEIFKKSIISQLDKYNGNQFLWYDCWSMSESHPKLFVNATKVYDYFGYKFYLPLWDNSLLHLFVELPLEHKKLKKLYDFTLENKLFKPLGVSFDTSGKVREKKIRVILINWAKPLFKSLLSAKIRYRFFSDDPINGKIYTRELVKRMKRNGFKINYTGTNSVKAQWYIKFLENRKS
ncbi:MAG: hypothetical protein HXX16_15325 [Bacteroidales bacterium]|nr:hypothetical protein [Bacteroidales bacterium]